MKFFLIEMKNSGRSTGGTGGNVAVAGATYNSGGGEPSATIVIPEPAKPSVRTCKAYQ